MTGRPTADEFAPYAVEDIAFVQGNDAIAALQLQATQVEQLFAAHSDSSVSGHRYAPNKWTVKEVLGHMIDDERIFAYRMLCVARADARPLAGFDEKDYVAATTFELQTLSSLMDQYRAVRASTISMLAPLTPDEWQRRGTANGYAASVRGLAFHVAGHELHHLRLLRSLYQL